MFYGISCDYKNAIENSEKYSVLQLRLGNLSDPVYPTDLDNFPELNSLIFIHSKICYNISKNNITYPISEETKFLNKQKNIGGIVIHLSKGHKRTHEEDLDDVIFKLQKLLEKYPTTKIIIETGYNVLHLGSDINDLAYISKKIPNIRFCIDTSHLYLSGHPIDRVEYFIDYIRKFEIYIGLEKIDLFHINDINSSYFGPHTPHLKIKEGKIFKNDDVLFFIKMLSDIYNIPIIFEHDIDNEEINFLDSIKTESENFEILLKNSILLFFLDEIINYNTFYNKTTIAFTEFRKLIVKSFDNDEFFVEKNDENFRILYDIVYKKEFEKILNKEYDAFDFLLKDCVYLEKKNMLSDRFFDKQFVDRLFAIKMTNYSKIKAIDTKERKRIFSTADIKIVKKIDYIREFDYDTAEDFVSKLNNAYKNLLIYGTYYRIKNDLEKVMTIDRIEILCVDNADELLDTLNTCFSLKTEIFHDDNRKINIYLYKKKYFTVIIHVCNKEEMPFMSLFLKTPENIRDKIYAIAKSKNMTMTDRYMKDGSKKIFFETEREMYNFLDIKQIY